jgi:signal transduction histidine kinase
MKKLITDRAKVYVKINNYGLKDTWSSVKRRELRQVNEFNLLVSILTFTTLPLLLVYKNYPIFITQFICLLGFTGGFYLTGKEKLKEARFFAIAFSEIIIFIHSVFTVYPTGNGFFPWYSPAFIIYMVFPMIAVIFDKSILRHVIIAMSMIVLIQFIAPYSSEYDYSEFTGINVGLIIIFTTIYTIFLIAILAHILSNKTGNVKDNEKESYVQLENAMQELRSDRDIIQKQVDELQIRNDSKNKFFSIIAHDLRSPFNVILGFSELLMEKEYKDPESLQYAKKIHDTALINYNLLDDLLKWTKTQMMNIEFIPGNLIMSDIVEQNIFLLKSVADKKNILLENKVDKSLNVMADSNILSIIIRNLVGNAIKFTCPGGKITIASQKVQNLAEISIQDNGVGIPQEIINTLFRIDKMQSRIGTSGEKGTGMGLILCQEFIESLGGKIRVESIENIGTTFYFTLPLAYSEE